MLSEKGILKETPPMKLLLTVFEQGLTGILYIKRNDILKVLYFNRGKLIWAISNWEEDKLENILISKNIVNLQTLQTVKKEAHVSDSIGKNLVERGLITLEELIDCSRDQLKRIIFDILKWKDGGFQFIKDTPPERLLSLDLNITDFIISFIVEQMDVSDIWKTIGSLQIELIRNPNEEKLSKYQLSDKQKELLQSFNGENKLETILSRHSGGHRESILKIIYFFLMSELVIKKEFDLPNLSVFESDREFNYFEENEQQAAGYRFGNPEEDDSDQRLDISQQTIKGLLEKQNRELFDGFTEDDRNERPREKFDGFRDDDDVERHQPENEILKKTFEYETEDEEPVEPPVQEEKKKRKFLHTALILIVLILAIGGAILLILPWLSSESPINTNSGKEKKAAEASDIIQIDEAKPNADDEIKVTPPPQTQPQPDQKIDNKTTDETKVDEKKADEKKVEEKKPEEKPKPQNAPLPSGTPAESYFKEGNLLTAGDVWKSELRKAGVKFAIMLEMDCQKESVLATYKRLENKKDFFIINKQNGGKICYLVMWGKFTTRQEATNALKSVPNYFWKQREPPEIIDLAKYY
ncbi:MAG: DUF4388 domain-containing protein [Candidatus Omnitrophota bacterium]